ncbi:GyrI-like domain-containing protein [uncultured Vagococcus sp.]|uniref:GyrI-like domain-containing protein n=1 Tax=uncultured Vagococcus sp. TaxID=189676 RepID=UPI00258370D8|nr:GyrI-like domain-containing protein [uncultured Vagococcus sp.]
MKHEWRKAEKAIYLPKGIEIVDIPSYSFLILDGEGDPNSEMFASQIEALYSVSYSIRMMLKKGITGESFIYTVYPLEGVWTTKDGSKDESLNKDQLVYRIMIRQPEQVTESIVSEAIKQTLKKKDNLYINQLKFETYTDGGSIQMVHTGSFDTEVQSFRQMDVFLETTEYERDWLMGEFVHREIYLSDTRRVVPEKRKTLLRYKLKEKN